MRKNILLVSLLIAGAMLSACSDSSSVGDGNEGLAVVDNGGERYTVNVPKYSYPDFLRKLDDINILSNVSTKSFDASMVTEVTVQPFENYNCLYTYPGLYIFEKDGFAGLLDSDGAEVVAADTFARAEFASPSLIRFYLYDTEDSAYVYVDVSDKASPKIIEDYKFRSNNIRLVERRQEDSDRVLTYIEVSGSTIGGTGYDSAAQKDIAELPADSGAMKAYTVTKDGAYYIITFDEFYNYTVYEGTYASIDLSIGGERGSCFIMSYEDDLEAKTLISSFEKRENSDGEVSHDEGEDYISFDFGLYGEDDYIVTLYASGAYISQGVRDGTAFFDSAQLDKRCFGDLVRWVGSVVSREYDIPQPQKKE